MIVCVDRLFIEFIYTLSKFVDEEIPFLWVY